MTSGVTPCALRISAAIEHKVSPRKRGSRPTITFGPFGFCERTYRAIPVTARRTLPNVNSSATTARHPEVPNLIVVIAMIATSLFEYRPLEAAANFPYDEKRALRAGQISALSVAGSAKPINHQGHEGVRRKPAR